MNFITKVSKYSLLHCYLFLMFAAIPVASFAQDIVDTSSPQDILAVPTLVVRSSTVELDCHSYTGCGAIVVKKHHTYHYHKPKHHRVYRRPCYDVGTVMCAM